MLMATYLLKGQEKNRFQLHEAFAQIFVRCGGY